MELDLKLEYRQLNIRLEKLRNDIKLHLPIDFKYQIVDYKSKNWLGNAVLGSDEVSISIKCSLLTDLELKYVLYHEVVHACFGVGHVEDCRLMGPKFLPDFESSTELDYILRYYFKKGGFAEVAA